MKMLTDRWWYRAGVVTIGFASLIMLGVLWLHFVKLDVIQDSSYRTELDKGKYNTNGQITNLPKYRVGETIIVERTFRKLRDVTGETSRYIICEQPGGAEAKFNIGEAEASRPPQVNVDSIYLKIPSVPVPAKCVIELDTYYGWPYKPESVRTDYFKVLKSKNNQATNNQMSPDRDHQVLENSPVSPDSPHANETFLPGVESENSQTQDRKIEDSDPDEPDERNIFDRAIDGARNILNEAENTVNRVL